MFNNYLQERHGHFDNFFTAHSQPQCKQLNLSPYPEYLYKSHLPKISPGQRYCRRPPASLRAAVDSIDHRAWGLCQNTRHNYIRWREIQQMRKLMFLLYCGMFGTLKKYLALSRFLLFVLSIHTQEICDISADEPFCLFEDFIFLQLQIPTQTGILHH